MAEYIEREAAVESFMSEFPDAHYPSWYAEKLKELPTADVAVVRHGEWIKYPHNSGIYCSRCRHKRRYKDANDNYCPNCGADMRGVEDGR